MIEFLVFDAPNSQQARDFYQKIDTENQGGLDTLDALVEEKEREWKDQTGWTERFLRSQQTVLSEDDHVADPYEVGLSEEDSERFRAHYPELGKGISLHCPVRLECVEIPDGTVKYLFGVRMSDWGDYESTRQDGISGLVDSVSVVLSELSSHFSGAGIIPAFYTYAGRTTDDGVQALREGLASVSGDDLKAIFGEHVRIPTAAEMGDITLSEYRGLSEQERNEFATLYQKAQQEHS